MIEARRRDLVEQLPAGGLKVAELDQQLAKWAELLRVVAPDFLDGDTAVIDEAAEALRQRVRENPQRVTVWEPEGTKSSSLSDVRASVPDNVEVRAGRYSRRRRRGQT